MPVNTQPKQLYYETTNTEDLPKKLFEHIHRFQVKKFLFLVMRMKGGNLNKWLQKLNFEVENKKSN
jgi:hypothetical protein